MSYNQERYEFKMTQAFSCLNNAIALTYSSVNHFLDISKVINKYGVLATVALSKTKQLNLTDTKLESIVKNSFFIYEVVETIIKASNTVAKDQQLLIQKGQIIGSNSNASTFENFKMIIAS